MRVNPDISPALAALLAAPFESCPDFPRLSPMSEKPVTAVTSVTTPELPPPSVTPRIPREPLPDLAAEEALYRVWWRTLPDKALAKRMGGHLGHWQRERRLSDAALRALHARVGDLLEGEAK